MQLKDLKILKLLDSPDGENKKLGAGILEKYLTKQNVVFWYVELEKRKIISEGLITKFTEHLGWPGDKAVITYIKECINHINKNHGSPQSGATLIKYYNNYITSLMTEEWTTQDRNIFKDEIFNYVYHTTAKPN